MKTIINFLPFVLGAYELLAHAIPTEKNHSLLNKIFTTLSALSNMLNITKKSGGRGLPLLTAAACLAFAFSSCKVIKSIDCKSVKYVKVTYVSKAGNFYTLDVPYCDTVILKTDNLPDTATLKNVYK